MKRTVFYLGFIFLVGGWSFRMGYYDSSTIHFLLKYEARDFCPDGICLKIDRKEVKSKEYA